MMIFCISSAFACAEHNKAIETCVKDGGTQAECQRSVHQAAEKAMVQTKNPETAAGITN